MRYEGKLFRPPFEANGLLVQVTLGCTHDECTFCDMYLGKKFRMRPYKEMEEDLIEARKLYEYVPSAFLMDANPLAMSMDYLRPIYQKIRELFPEVKSINTYGRYTDVLNKTPEELLELKNLGLKRLSIGLESGSDIVLKKIKKGVTADQIIEASEKLKVAGIEQYAGMILGLGEIAGSDEHITETLRVINKIKPAGVGMAPISAQTGTSLYESVQNGSFELPTFEVVYGECIRMLRELDLPGTPFDTGIIGPKRTFVYNGILGQNSEKAIQELENIYSKNIEQMKNKVFTNLW